MTTEPGEPGELFRPPPARMDAGKKRATFIQSMISLALVVIIFGWLLPKVIDYQEVGEALGTLDAWQFGVLLVAGLIVFVPSGWLYALLAPGLTLGQGMTAWVASTGVGSTVPAVNLVVRYGMYRSWGVSVESSMLGIFLTGVFDNVVRFSLPVLAVLLTAALGFDGLPAAVIWIAVIAGVIVACTLVVAIGAARSERFAARLGEVAENVANWGLAKVKRPAMSGIADKVVGVRDLALDTVLAVWPRAVLASALATLWTYVILLVSVRFAGIPSDVITPGQAFLVWTLVLLVQAVPLTPGGVGFVEAAYIALFGAIAGEAYSTQIAVAVVLYRAAQWALPIVIGWPLVGWWRREIRLGNLPDPFTS